MRQLGKTYNIGFQFNAMRGSGFDAAFSRAQQEFARLGKEIQSLDKLQSDVSAYQKQQAAVEKTTAKLDNLRQQEALLVTQIEAAKKAEEQDAAAIAGLEREKLKLAQQISNTESALERQNQKLAATGERLKEAKVDTGDLTTASARLSSQLEELRKEQNAAAEGAQTLGEKTAGAFEAAQQVLASAGIAASLNEVCQALWDCADASMEFETAMAGVRRTVGGSEADIAAMGEDFKDLSARMPITTSELAKIAETAGQLGIAQEAVGEFTEVMAMLGTTTDLTADTAATMLAQFSNITGVTDYRRLGSAVADLGDATATTASKVVEMSQGMAAAAHLAGMSETDILGIAAAVGSLGIESQAGSTAMSTLISTLYKAVETGDALADFAAVANMSAAQFKTAWGQDAVGAMDAFIQGLNDTERNGRSAIVILDELGITNVRQTKAVLGLASAGDLLSGAITQANAAWSENTALQAKADVMYNTTESRLTMMRNAWNNLKIAIGDNYTPALEGAYGIGTDLLAGMTQFVRENPSLVKGVVAGGAAFAGLGTAIMGVNAAMKLYQALNVAALFTGPAGAILGGAAALAGLTAAVVTLIDATRDGGPAVRELTTAARELNETMEEGGAACADTAASALAAADVAGLYIGKLEEMGDAAQLSGDEQKRYQNTLALLLQVMPSLSDCISQTTDEYGRTTYTLETTTAALRANTEEWKKNAQAQAYQEYLNSIMAKYNGVLLEAAENEIGLTRAQYNHEAANQKYNAALERMNTLYEEANRKAKEQSRELGTTVDAAAYLTQEYYDLENTLADLNKEIYDAQSDITAHEKAIEADREAVSAFEEEASFAETAWNNLMESLGLYTDGQEKAADAAPALEGALASVRSQIDLLAASYQDAYNDAYESISGQMGLFETMSVKVDMSANDMIASLESQVSYMTTYSENLRKAAEMGVSQGLLARLSDGSTQSAAYLQAIVDAGEEKVPELNAALAKVDEGKEDFSNTVAEMKTGLEEALDTMEQNVLESVQAMELTDEAAESARNTIQAFIDETDSMLPQVSSAFERVRYSAMKAISEGELKIKYAGTTYISPHALGYASGTDNAPPGWAWVGEEGPELIHMRGGETVLPAEISREFANLPYDSAGFLPYSSAAEATPGTAAMSAAEAKPAPIGGTSLQLTIHVDGNAGPETVEALRDQGEEIVERVLEELEVRQADAIRRAMW